MNFKRLFSFIISIAICVSSLNLSAVASASIDRGTKVPITEYGQVVDSITFNGKKIDSIYAPHGQVSGYSSDPTFCCAAFVKKFYNIAYGITLTGMFPGNTPQIASGPGGFCRTSTPQVGDIAASATHWAIVKEVTDEHYIFIEQNCWSDNFTTASVERKMTKDETKYWFWRYTYALSGTEEIQTEESQTEGSQTEEQAGAGEAPKPTKIKNKPVKTPSKVKNVVARKGKKHSVTITWNRKDNNVNGYTVQCAKNKSFSSNVKTSNNGVGDTSATFNKLKGGKTYYVRVRAYKYQDGKKYNGSWSKVKKCKIS